MTRAGRTLDDVPARVPWRALRAFVRHLDESSSLYREIHPEMGGWTRTQIMLADEIDAINAGRRAIVSTLARKNVGRRVAYPRPWVKDATKKKIGRDAVSIAEFERFWASGPEATREEVDESGD